MPTLEELLRASLEGANEKFDQANRALHAAAAETAKAIDAVTGGKATLRLVATNRTMESTYYELVVSLASGKQSRSLGFLKVPQSGYPIERLEDVGGKSVTRIVERFGSSEDLAEYFRRLAAAGDSPLVGYLAYIIRNPPAE